MCLSFLVRAGSLFLSTLSLRRATKLKTPCVKLSIISIHALLAESDCPLFFSCWLLAYFYPRSPCGERRKEVNNGRFRQNISIHALLAESDRAVSPFSYKSLRISIHALLAESDLPNSLAWVLARLFLSTLSLRRATHAVVAVQLFRRISIHALLAESDDVLGGVGQQLQNFYPRSPCGERPDHPTHKEPR